MKKETIDFCFGSNTSKFGDIGSRQRANVSSWIRHHQQEKIVIKNADITSLLSIVAPPVSKRISDLLLLLASKTEDVGERVELDVPYLVAQTWSKNINAFLSLVRALASSGNIENNNVIEATRFVATVTPQGWSMVEQLQARGADSAQGFVAMWFENSMMEIFSNAIAPAIEKAGYHPHLVNQREHVGKIDDEIVSQIRRSRFVVADFTGHRGGVYYEAGFAHGLGLPVFFSCDKAKMKELHFDIRQYNCIDWIDGADLRERLQKRIEAVIGRGPIRK